MKNIKDFTILRQRSRGIITTGSQQGNGQTMMNLINPAAQPSLGQKIDIGGSANTKVTNTSNQATWMILQDWSQCSLACGGGTSTLHRMCVPPQGSTILNCEGPAVMTKPCNTQSCPDLYNTIAQNAKNTETLKPIVKVLPFSNRPQRYTKCVVKESDMMLRTENNSDIKTSVGAGTKTPDVQIPTRVVMNNKTISIFKGVEYEDLIMSFNMPTCQFKRSINTYPGCFRLREGQKNTVICPFTPEKDNRTVEEWDYDFNLFKNQCSTPRDVLQLDQGAMQQKLEAKIVKIYCVNS
jgi:hypothetical protein